MPLDFFEKIAAHFQKDLPFVVYRKPREATVKAIFQFDDRLHHLQTYAETGFIFAPFNPKRETLLLVPDEILEFSAPTPPNDGKNTDVPRPSPVRAGLKSDKEKKRTHLHLVNKALDEIKKGIFKKVVLSRHLEIGSEVLPTDLFLNLLANYPAAFCYLWYHPKVGLWLGATPEILLRLRNRQLTTMSLAGTQKYSESENPAWGHKELEEQEMVTDYIFHALQNQVSDLRRTNAETVRAGDLLHLRTRISGLIEKGSLKPIIKALHPTPAVCGLPKETARKFISDNENYDREYYTGFLGELNLKTEKQRNSRTKNQENQAYRSLAKTTTLYVNLRCMQIKDNRALIYVGGGITKDSDPEREWEETVAKSKTMLQIL